MFEQFSLQHNFKEHLLPIVRNCLTFNAKEALEKHEEKIIFFRASHDCSLLDGDYYSKAPKFEKDSCNGDKKQAVLIQETVLHPDFHNLLQTRSSLCDSFTKVRLTLRSYRNVDKLVNKVNESTGVRQEKHSLFHVVAGNKNKKEDIEATQAIAIYSCNDLASPNNLPRLSLFLAETLSELENIKKIVLTKVKKEALGHIIVWLNILNVDYTNSMLNDKDTFGEEMAELMSTCKENYVYCLFIVSGHCDDSFLSDTNSQDVCLVEKIDQEQSKNDDDLLNTLTISPKPYLHFKD